MARSILLALTVLALSACKLHVMVPRGGEVQSLSSGTCSELSACIHDIADTNYTESFTAIPAPGYEFVNWSDGTGFQCAKSSSPQCVVDSTPLSGFLTALQVFMFQDIYMMPVFREVPSGEIADCRVSAWSDWMRDCPFNCGSCVQTRTRQIIQAPVNGGLECPQLTEQVEVDLGVCPPELCQPDDESQWDPCEAGVVKDGDSFIPQNCSSVGQRTYRGSTGAFPSELGGGACTGFDRIHRCDTPPCADCQFSPWSEWSQCRQMSSSCEDGFYYGWTERDRTIVAYGTTGGLCAGTREYGTCYIPCQ